MQNFYRNAHVYDTVEKVQRYWNRFRSADAEDESYINKWLQQSHVFDLVSCHQKICITLWDVVAHRFIYAADKTRVLGDNADRFVEQDGIDFFMSRFPRGHVDAIMTIQLKAHEYYSAHPELLPHDLVISEDCRYSADRRQIHILKQVYVLEVDENKKPLLFLSYIHDITHLKKEPSAALVLASSDETILYNYNFPKSKLVEANPVTTREKKVLELLQNGSGTKEIAEKLQISPHTVDTHRRNLLAKTCCVDTTALVTYSKMVGLI